MKANSDRLNMRRSEETHAFIGGPTFLTSSRSTNELCSTGEPEIVKGEITPERPDETHGPGLMKMSQSLVESDEEAKTKDCSPYKQLSYLSPSDRQQYRVF